MTTTNKAVIGVLVLSLVLSVSAFFKPINVNVNTAEKDLGNQITNEHSDNQFFYGGVYGVQSGFFSTTSNACMIRNPLATSTFQAAYRITVATTTTTVLSWATSTAAARWATTTQSTAMLTSSNGANVSGVSSYVGRNEQNIIGPGEFVVLRYDPGTTLGSVPQAQGGICDVLFYGI